MDLRLINETMVPIHPVGPNPHTLLSQIPEDAGWPSVLDLKDDVLCILLCMDPQSLFAFKNPHDEASQLTRPVLPQEFRDGPHLFGQVSSHHLPYFKFPQVTVQSMWMMYCCVASPRRAL